MHASHQPIFVILSLAVAVLGSWTALDLSRKVRSHLGSTRLLWLAISALVMGLSIWSMHFVAMLGFDPGSAVEYDPLLTLASLVLAIGTTAGAFFFVAQDAASFRRTLLAGVLMGCGICLMHYVGMAALRTAVSLGYEPSLVILSLIIAIAASTMGLLAAGRDGSFVWRVGAALTLGVAIVGMHYTAMAALHLRPAAGAVLEDPGAPPYMLAVSVAAGTILILLLALMASLYDQRGHMQSALEAGGVGYWEYDSRTGVFHASPQVRTIMDLEPDRTLPYDTFVDLFHPDETTKRKELLRTTLSTGADYDAELRLANGKRWVHIRGRLISGSADMGGRMVGIIIDITDRKLAFNAVAESERRQRIMIDELNHRVKNTLATIQSIATLTSRRAPSLEVFRQSFEARLLALSATHNALTLRSWERVGLRELFSHELSPYSEERFRLAGPDVELRPEEALSLGMVFHELATNAAKYGALSELSGVVRVDWSVTATDAGPMLTVEWVERGGPPVSAPSQTGFGSRLIAMSMQTSGGQAQLRYGASGFECSLLVPLAAEEAKAALA